MTVWYRCVELYQTERDYLIACLEDVKDAVEDDGERTKKERDTEVRYINRLIKKLGKK